MDPSKNKTISNLYDLYYKGGSNSLYNRRFGKIRRVTLREQKLLISHLKRSIELATDETVKLIDFGCGNGRTMPLLYQHAFLHEDKKFEIVAYDISKVGLDELSHLLVTDGFQLIGNELENRWYLKKNNVTVKIYLGNSNFSIAELEQLFGEGFHLILSLYGALSHIPGSARRLEILQVFKNIASNNSILLLSLPSYASEKTALKKFNGLRSKNNVLEAFPLAKEKGDVYYKIKESSNIYNFYHLYSIEEAEKQLTLIKILNPAIGIYSTFSIPKICKSWLYTICDYYLSRILSSRLLRNFSLIYFSTNFFVSAKIEN